MADITKYLSAIEKASYGEEVRGSIHDALEKMNEEASRALENSIKANTDAETALELSTTITPSQCTFMNIAQLDWDSSNNIILGAPPSQAEFVQVVPGATYSLYRRESTYDKASRTYTWSSPKLTTFSDVTACDSSRFPISGIDFKFIDNEYGNHIGFAVPSNTEYIFIHDIYIPLDPNVSSCQFKLVEGNPYSYYVNQEANDRRIEEISANIAEEKASILKVEIEENNRSIEEVKNGLENILDLNTDIQYVQVEDVIKHDGYVWSQYNGNLGTTLVETSNRTAVEFEVCPNTEYIIQGMNAGTALNYAIGFYQARDETYSTSTLIDATQETYEGKPRCTRFTTPDDCHYVRYTVYQNVSYDMQLEGRVVSEYVQKPMPWVIQPNGTEDMTDVITEALTTYGICQLTAGDYYVSENGIVMPDNSTLTGDGAGTRVFLGGAYDSTVGQCVTMGSDCTVRDLTFMGWTANISMAGSLLERHGILWTEDGQGNKPFRGTVENCRFMYFKGGAITCKATGSDISNCLNVSDCYISYCRAGINIDYLSEYHRFNNVHITACYYGAINNGGNNMFSNCLFTKNKVGFLMDNTDNDKVNNSHGSVVGCTFNHSDNNKGTGIKIINMKNGFVFSACQIFYSKIELTDSSGIVFDHCNFGNQEEIAVNGGGVTLFDGCTFKAQPTLSTTNNENVLFNGCFSSSGEVVNERRKLICTIVDDDAVGATNLGKLKDACDLAGVKATVATITSLWENSDYLLNYLQTMEQEGYEVVLHAYSQASGDAWSTHEIVGCTADLAKGVQMMRKNGFRTDFWVTPDNMDTDEIRHLARKFGFKARLTGKNTYNGNGLDISRYDVKRCSLHHSDEGGTLTLDELKEIAVECANNMGWLVIMTHFQNWEEGNYDRFTETVEYLKGLGYEFMTLSEAWTYREPIFRQSEKM